MYHHPDEIEINVAYARERIMGYAEATRRVPRGERTVAPSAPGWLRRGLGRRLIAVGEKLAGSSVCPPAPAGRAV